MPNVVRWLFAPASDDAPRGSVGAATFLRVLLGLMWLYQVSWKVPPDFGAANGTGLFRWASLAVEHPVLPPYSWAMEQLVLPNLAIFGWGVLLVETVLAVLLLTGTLVRVAAALGIAQSLAIGLSVAFAPNEWPWAYLLMIGAHLVIMFSSAGRIFAVDAVRSGLTRPEPDELTRPEPVEGPRPDALRQAQGTVSTALLGQVWGVIAVIVGVFSALSSIPDPLSNYGPGLTSTELEVGLGNYNLAGGLVLILAGLLILVAARTRVILLGWVAAALAGLAGLSLHIQIGFTNPILGGTATSAAFLFSIALIAATVARAPGRS